MKRQTGPRVEDIHVASPYTADSVTCQMLRAGGFTGRHFAEAVDILENMIKDGKCTRFLSFPAAPVATGLRGVLKDLTEKCFPHVIVTTCGTLDHDLCRSWESYYAGDFGLDDRRLSKMDLHRLGNVIVPKESYGPLLERRLQPFFEDLYQKGVRKLSTSQLCRELGAYVKNDASILTSAWKNSIPVIVPAPMDGAVGSQLWLFSQKHKDFQTDLIGDQDLLSNLIFDARKTGALMIGGGVSKHHTLWWNQFRGGLDYAVNITTAVEYDGSLSGALVREAISWGKVRPEAKQVTVHGDATMILPFMAASLLERCKASWRH